MILFIIAMSIASQVQTGGERVIQEKRRQRTCNLKDEGYINFLITRQRNSPVVGQVGQKRMK